MRSPCLGTELYKPIEQYEKRGQFGAYTDIYALAVTLYHLLTGAAPGGGSYLYRSKERKDARDKGLDKQLDEHLWGELAKTGVSERTQAAIKAGMEIEPSQRPQNITAFCKLLGSRYKQANVVTASYEQVPVSKPVILTTQEELRKQVYSSPVVTSKKAPNRRMLLLWLGGIGGLTGAGLIGSFVRNFRQSSTPIFKVSSNLISSKDPKDTSQTNVSSDVIISTLKTIEFATVKLDNRGEIIARPLGTAQILKEDLGNGLNLTMVSIPGGSFMMGAPENEQESENYERPQHQVTVSDFYMGQTLITQSQYQSIMEENPSRFKGDNRPVENVQWKEAQEFCRKLSVKTKNLYALPSESCWEYACRGGTITPFYFGNTITTDTANYSANYTYGNAPKGLYRKETTIVDTFPPNPFGLYDMHGNIWEWCEDHWHENYKGAPTDGSIWDSENDTQDRVLRGGAWYLKPRFCRSASRTRWSAKVKSNNFGFRVVGIYA